MKIICIGRNYGKHALELGNEIPDEPVIFMKPATALLHDGKPFFIPDFSADIHHEIEVVLKVCQHGKAIEEKFAHRYYEELSLGIDFTARDLQQQLKEARLPWEKAKAFDGSAVIGKFVAKDKLPDVNQLNFELSVNGAQRQVGHTSDMLFSFDRIIAEVSKYFKLMKGDLIYTGTPAGVARVVSGDHLIGTLEGQNLLDMRVK